MKKFNYEYVKRIFEENGCFLLSQSYEDIKKPLDYICSCGNQSTITFDNFKRGRRCNKCGRNKQIESQKHEYEFVKDYFESHNCVLISKKYTRVHDKLEYICECGVLATISFSDFQNGKRCWDCGRRKVADSHRLSHEVVYNFFKEQNCILLSEEYVNAHQKLDYICECGNISEITFDKFKSGQRCNECRYVKIGDKLRGTERPDMQGSNNPNWNSLMTDEEREIKRTYPEYREWRNKVYFRDDYTCQICGVRGSANLVAHHLDGYNWCFEKRTDVDNGVTMCEECHLDFHHTYGWRDNTREQWTEYLEDFLKEYETV